MIDITQYRSHIGLFRQKCFSRDYLYRRKFYETASWNEDKTGKIALLSVQFLFKLMVIFVLTSSIGVPASVRQQSSSNLCTPVNMSSCSTLLPPNSVTVNSWSLYTVYREGILVTWSLRLERETGNFWARYTNGNSRGNKGILNMHLNIRSL